MAEEGGTNEGTIPSHDSQSTFLRMSDMVQVTRLPRSTIRYYERMGVLREEDHFADGRYTDAGRKRLGTAILLKNLGYSPREMVELLNDCPLSIEHICQYQDKLSRNMAYIEAQRDCLESWKLLVTCPEELWVSPVERYRFKKGMAKESEPPMYIPISGFGGVFSGPVKLAPTSFSGGRAVAERHADLIEGFPEDLPVVGGCTCVQGIWTHTRADVPVGIDESLVEFFEKAARYLDEHGLAMTGNAFVTGGMMVEDSFRSIICLPVESKKSTPVQGVKRACQLISGLRRSSNR